MNEEKHCCEFCDEELTENEVYRFDGVVMCKDCYDEKTIICDRCGKRMWIDDATFDCNGNSYCDDCADIETAICDDCGVRVPHDGCYTDESGTCVCTDCYNNHDWYTCEDCNALIREYDAYWGDDDYVYCENCIDRHRRGEGIDEYGYKPEPVFYGKYNKANTRFFGVELEVDGGGESGDNATQLKEIANNDEERIYIKSDGSIDDGFEIVSHPMTLDYHINEMPWADVMRKAVSMNYRSHQTSTCGLHIHVNRVSLGSNVAEQEETIGKILFFVEKHWDEIVKFTRRTESRLNQWAARYGYESSPKAIMDKVKKSNFGRYCAVNLCNYSTIEFRIFRGTLKLNTFIATLQFVNKVCELCTTETEEAIETMSWSEFVNSVTEPELIQYLKERNLYNEDDDSTDAEEDI